MRKTQLLTESGARSTPHSRRKCAMWLPNTILLKVTIETSASNTSSDSSKSVWPVFYGLRSIDHITFSEGVTPTDQEMDELIENPNPEIFIQGVKFAIDMLCLYSYGFFSKHLNQLTMARQQLEEINARHQDIVKIEKSVRELHEMFTDMANLVAQQVRIHVFE